MPLLSFFVPFPCLVTFPSPCPEIWTGSYFWTSFASSVIASYAPGSCFAVSRGPCGDLVILTLFYFFSAISLCFCFFFSDFCSVSLGSYSVTWFSSSLLCLISPQA